MRLRLLYAASQYYRVPLFINPFDAPFTIAVPVFTQSPARAAACPDVGVLAIFYLGGSFHEHGRASERVRAVELSVEQVLRSCASRVVQYSISYGCVQRST